MNSPVTIQPGRPWPLGATPDARGVNFAVFSSEAERIDLCLFDAAGGREIATLPLVAGESGLWTGHVASLPIGALYGLRAHGRYEPSAGLRFNANKLLVDPYARAFDRPLVLREEHLGYRFGGAEADLGFDDRDSAAFMPKCVVCPPDMAPFIGSGGGSSVGARPDTPWADTLVYEAHVRGFTLRHPAIPQAMRGRFEGMAQAAVVAWVKALGVTAIELLPVQAFTSEPALLRRGLVNYWGYNTFGFFAPQVDYGTAASFKSMVRALHDAGIEVILDVVYNHTAESDELGPTLMFRGLDNRAYYRLADDRRYYVNDTGTGNTLNFSHPRVVQLVNDSLRYWAGEMGVDGFRFDLATVLAREQAGFDAGSGWLDSVAQDPLLGRLKMIAEPWDIGPGGYQVGRFPPGWTEWNDRFRDCARRFWRGDERMLPELASRLHGSADLFQHDGRLPRATLNFVTSHDGFTLADLTSYDQRHNEANGEGNRDGHGDNLGSNHGVEGTSDDPAVMAARRRTRLNLLTTLLLAQGVPMLLAGDELGHSQGGNNNAYCQDNETTWIDWSRATAEHAFTQQVRRLAALRHEFRALRSTRWLQGRADGAPGPGQMRWLDAAGREMPIDGWQNPRSRAIGLWLCGDDLIELLIVFNAGEATHFDLPEDGADGWHSVFNTADAEAEPLRMPLTFKVAERSVRLLKRKGVQPAL